MADNSIRTDPTLDDWDFEVARDDLTRSRVVPAGPAALAASRLAEGEIRLAVDRFALTANNITYASMGAAMRYWDFFPSAEPGQWGRVPVWGHAEVTASRHPDIAAGERIYGYFPMSSGVTLRPARVSAASFIEGSPHRAELAAAYNLYMRCAADPAHDPATEDYRSLLMPLFVTSFLIDDMLGEADFFGARQVLITSASGKTAIALASLLHHRRAGAVRVTGLTAGRNISFVSALGWYDEVIDYDSLTTLDAGIPAVIVDFAGDGPLRNTLHQRFGAKMLFSLMVGLSHPNKRAEMKDLPGARPVLFFAPDRLKKRSADWGRDGLNARIAASWQPFLAQARSWLKLQVGTGPEAFRTGFAEMLAGRTPPDRGVILRPRT